MDYEVENGSSSEDDDVDRHFLKNSYNKIKLKKNQDKINEFCKMLLATNEHLKYYEQENQRMNSKLDTYQKTIENLRIGFYKDLVNIESHSVKLEADYKNQQQAE